MTDEALIDLFWARDAGAVEALKQQYGAYCSAILWQFLVDSRDVEECLNDVYLAVWRAIPPTRPEHFRGWLGAIARNRAIAKGKENGRRPETVEESALELASCLSGSDVHTEAECAELGRMISEFLKGQKADVRCAFLRRYWYADSVEATARYMGWSGSKTKSVLFRVRNRLRDYLVKEGLL